MSTPVNERINRKKHKAPDLAKAELPNRTLQPKQKDETDDLHLLFDESTNPTYISIVPIATV